MQAMSQKSPNCWADFRIFPIHVNTPNEAQRKNLESQVIFELKRGKLKERCINNVVPPLGKRLRHRQPPIGAPTGAQPQRNDLRGTLQHVMTVSDANRFEVLSKMTTNKVRKLIKLTTANAPVQQQMRQVVREQLAKKKTEPSKRTNLVVSWTSKKLNNVNIGQILRQNSTNWPLHNSWIQDTRISYKHNTVAGSQFRNHTTASLNIASCNISCDCHLVAEEYKVQGHVLTANTEVLLPLIDYKHQQSMTDLITQEGSKFRFSLRDLNCLAALRQDLDRFITTCAKKQGTILEDDAKTKWTDAMYHNISWTFFEKTKSSSIGNLPIKTIMKRIHEKFVLAPADKAPQNTVIWCKKLYHDSIMDELNSPTFELCENRSPQDILTLHQEIARRYGKQAHGALPYMYHVAKIHKLEANSERKPIRPIVGKSPKNTGSSEVYGKSGVNSLSDVNIQAAAMLNSIKDLLLLADRKSKIKYCWFIKSPQEFIDRIGADKTIENMTTADFSSMFTGIPLDDLISELHAAIDLSVGSLAELFQVTHDEATKLVFRPDGKWAEASPNHPKSHWTTSTLKKAITDLINSSYILMNNQIFQQVIGIGMGHETSPPMADLYLHMKERKFIDKFRSTYGDRVVASARNNFQSYARYLDDLFFPEQDLSRPHDWFPTYLDYGGLQLKITHEGKNVKFIGITTTVSPRTNETGGDIQFTIFDKQRGFNFPVIRYPSWHTNCPSFVLSGCILGVLTRSLCLTSRTTDFIVEATRSLNEFVGKRKYPIEIIKRAVHKFAHKQLLPAFRHETVLRITTSIGNDEPPQPTMTPTNPAARTAQADQLSTHIDQQDQQRPPSALPVPQDEPPLPRRQRQTRGIREYVNTRRARTRAQVAQENRHQAQIAQLSSTISERDHVLVNIVAMGTTAIRTLATSVAELREKSMTPTPTAPPDISTVRTTSRDFGINTDNATTGTTASSSPPSPPPQVNHHEALLAGIEAERHAMMNHLAHTNEALVRAVTTHHPTPAPVTDTNAIQALVHHNSEMFAHVVHEFASVAETREANESRRLATLVDGMTAQCESLSSASMATSNAVNAIADRISQGNTLVINQNNIHFQAMTTQMMDFCRTFADHQLTTNSRALREILSTPRATSTDTVRIEVISESPVGHRQRRPSTPPPETPLQICDKKRASASEPQATIVVASTPLKATRCESPPTRLKSSSPEPRNPAQSL